VAVKLRSHSSNQGNKEFLAEVPWYQTLWNAWSAYCIHVGVQFEAEIGSFDMKIYVLVQAQILTRIHHKNLVSMIGYCKDGEYMALVYEYMAQGTLREHIAGMHTKFISL
jgi:serine/threonine protein kinase